MKDVDRMAAIIRPKQPYIDWANTFVKEGEAEYRVDEDTPTIYLIPPFNNNEEGRTFVEDNFEFFFVDCLTDWTLVDDRWPEMTVENFNKWLDIQIVSMVQDYAKWDEEDQLHIFDFEDADPDKKVFFDEIIMRKTKKL